MRSNMLTSSKEREIIEMILLSLLNSTLGTRAMLIRYPATVISHIFRTVY